MPVLTIENRTVSVDAEGFLTDYVDWDDDLARTLAHQIGITLTDRHWEIMRFLRQDFADQGETATLRRTSLRCDIPIRDLFVLFPGKPAKKMAYIAGLPKPRGCV
jgi:tRNA 2-thiouridine synthesizing protein E